MKCPECRTQNREGRRFCAQCGASLLPSTRVTCPECGFSNEAHERFCGGCGVSLAGAAGPSPAGELPAGEIRFDPLSDTGSAERRHLSVMFADLAGSTTIAEKLDPEQLRELMLAYQKACTAVIERFDGIVARYMGDGILAYFGYPRAHEDAAERAVHAGLGVVEAVRRLAPGIGSQQYPELSVRVGIATGMVVVGDLIGSGPSAETAVVGETPNMAARLQGLAEPNTVVIGPSTHQLTAGLFEHTDCGEHRLKGISEPVHVWRADRVRRTESRFEATRASASTPIDRNEEAGLLLRRWQQAKEREGQVVLLSGEPGIGKSHICQRLNAEIANEPHTRLRFQCLPYHANSALYPVISYLEWAAGIQYDDSPVARLDKLETLIGQLEQPDAAAVALLAALLSIPSCGRYAPIDLTPARQKEHTLETLLVLVQSLSRDKPVLVVFEDVHWADPTSLDLLERMVDRARSERILMLITFRPKFAPPWAEDSHVTTLALNRLSRNKSMELLLVITGGKALPGEVQDRILAKADGVPLFLEELTRPVLESALLRDDGDHYTLTGPAPQFAIPETLHDSLMARLDRDESAKEVAQVAALIGRTFTAELLAAVSALDEKKIGSALDELVKAGVIIRHRSQLQVDYSFKHALVQDAAYESLLHSKRRRLHGRVAQVLEERFHGQAVAAPEILAHHYTAAALPEQAAVYWTRAAEHALARSAHLEAAAHLQQGLHVLKDIADPALRARTELSLQINLGVANASIKGYAADEAEAAYARARELCEGMGDSSQLVDVLWGLWGFYIVRGRLRTARALAKQFLSSSQRADDALFTVAAHYALGATLFYVGDFTGALQQMEEGLSLYEPATHAEHVRHFGQNPGVACNSYVSWCFWFLGHPDEALRRSSDALALARELDHHFSLAYALNFSSRLLHLCGQHDVAERHADEAIQIAEDRGYVQWAAMGRIMRGKALVERGQLEQGLENIREGWDAYHATGAELAGPYALGWLAEAHLRMGNNEQALCCVDTALREIGEFSPGFQRAELYRLRGLCLLEGDRASPLEAEEAFHRAIEHAREQRAKSWEIRAASSLCRLWLAQGKTGPARALLDDVLSWFTEGFDTKDLREARALSAELHAASP